MSLKSPGFQGFVWQLNNSQPVITAPSPDVDFPFLVPYDYAAQSQPIMGWSMRVSKLHHPVSLG